MIHSSKWLLATLLLCTISIVPVLAQKTVNEPLLTNFKYRTNGYKALTFFGDFRNLVRDTREADTAKSGILGAGLSGEARYMRSLSTDKRQRLTLLYGSANPLALTKNWNAGSRNSSNASNFSFDWNDFNRIFREAYFLEYGTAAGVSGLFTSDKNNGQTTRARTLSFRADLTVGAGKGRLEHISDMQTALFILQELKKEGKLKSFDPSTADKFGRFITELRNGRVFDLRKRTRFQIKQIDQFLRENNLISETDADEIGIINDNMYFSFNNDLSPLPNSLHRGWEGGINPGTVPAYYNNEYISLLPAYLFNSGGDLIIFPDYISEFNVHTLQPQNEQTMRLSGQRLYVRGRGSYLNYDSNNPLLQGSASIASRGVVAQAGIEKHRPLSLQWQDVLSCNLNFYTARNSNQPQLRFFQDRIYNATTTEVQAKLTSFYLDTYYAKRYYPNGRTSIEGSAGLNIFYSRFTGDNSPSQATSTGGVFKTSVLATYFLNNNTVIRGEFNLYFSQISKKEVTTLKQGTVQSLIGVSLNHTFF